MAKLGRVGIIGRFKPLHNGGARLLENICRQAKEVIIGIGSVNKYNVRNPFTAEESAEMIHSFLNQRFNNYKVVFVPDFAHIPDYKDGNKWKEHVKKVFGELDYFISGNNYVSELLKDTYKIMHPANIVPKEEWIRLRAAKVRLEMVYGNKWKELVPEPVVNYLEINGIIERFREEFGLATLALILEDYKIFETETRDEEIAHAREL